MFTIARKEKSFLKQIRHQHPLFMLFVIFFSKNTMLEKEVEEGRGRKEEKKTAKQQDRVLGKVTCVTKKKKDIDK